MVFYEELLRAMAGILKYFIPISLIILFVTFEVAFCVVCIRRKAHRGAKKDSEDE